MQRLSSENYPRTNPRSRWSIIVWRHHSAGWADAGFLVFHVAIFRPDVMHHVCRSDIDSSSWHGYHFALVEALAKAHVQSSREHGAVSRIGMSVRRNAPVGGNPDTQNIGTHGLLGPQHPRRLQGRSIRYTNPGQAFGQDGPRGSVCSASFWAKAAPEKPQSSSDSGKIRFTTSLLK